MEKNKKPENDIRLDPNTVAAYGDPDKYGFRPRRYRHVNGLMLEIDDNFKLFCVPHPRTMDFTLLGPGVKVASRGIVVAGSGLDGFQAVIRAVGDYLSKTGTMHTYASINLTSKTGVGRTD